jgi:hypothetical protein
MHCLVVSLRFDVTSLPFETLLLLAQAHCPAIAVRSGPISFEEPTLSSASEAKLNANRANAQLSTGPKTDAGKAKVSLNAVKTGLTGRTVLLPSDDVAAYEAAVLRFTDRWHPETEEECILVQALADNDWRLQRIPTLEFGIYAMGERELADEFADETDPQIRRSLIQTKVFLTHRRELMNLQTQESRLRRQRQQDEDRLQNLQSRRKGREFERQSREAAAAQHALVSQQNSARLQKSGESATPSSKGGFEFANLAEAGRVLGKTASSSDILTFMRNMREQMEDDEIAEELQNAIDAA